MKFLENFEENFGEVVVKHEKHQKNLGVYN